MLVYGQSGSLVLNNIIRDYVIELAKTFISNSRKIPGLNPDIFRNIFFVTVALRKGGEDSKDTYTYVLVPLLLLILCFLL